MRTGIKDQCLGCEACTQICGHSALKMVEDEEGFRYPQLNPDACVGCRLCNKVCPEEEKVSKYSDSQIAFGGYALDEKVRCFSTSGGAFSCIVETWCKENYVIFGAVAEGLEVYHNYITDKTKIEDFRKSKYTQSKIGYSYVEVRKFLKEGKNVLFSGTPCQIAGLRKFLSIGKNDLSRLLTVEVVCEGVPSPLYIKKFNTYITEKYHSPIERLDYRYKDGKYDLSNTSSIIKRKGRWDFEVMNIRLKDGKTIKKDRWFNPFWKIWLNHLMNRPSCYKCPYATPERVADITLGDLWGVHLYCPDLYGSNGGSSVVVANSEKGREAMFEASKLMYGRPLEMKDVLCYQGPMRRCIPANPERGTFMQELENPSISYEEINNKWASRPGPRLLWSKYIWGNHQKIRFHYLLKKLGIK